MEVRIPFFNVFYERRKTEIEIEIGVPFSSVEGNESRSSNYVFNIVGKRKKKMDVPIHVNKVAN